MGLKFYKGEYLWERWVGGTKYWLEFKEYANKSSVNFYETIKKAFKIILCKNVLVARWCYIHSFLLTRFGKVTFFSQEIHIDLLELTFPSVNKYATVYDNIKN